MKPEMSGGLVHELPGDLAKALVEKELVSSWEALSAIGRNEFICWIEDAKQQKTRIKRIVRATEDLLEGKKRPCCWVGCIHRTDKQPGKWQQQVLIDKKKK
ncbi:YdeI/OmpD-associated family protein [Rheinheimera baltica]|uniref:YdeI/OmpD-associated family protein n=1 Tax=Rheinheimera baltica TaxID=67576 RepID=A0ABT9I252_9GAMM|nr:YdeI/OmpD-associated family protein [Rheinheimera baltica]MDP5137470.1 YdeI/OmpD-associated family protein [Rheinheimera baltica]